MVNVAGRSSARRPRAGDGFASLASLVILVALGCQSHPVPPSAGVPSAGVPSAAVPSAAVPTPPPSASSKAVATSGLRTFRRVHDGRGYSFFTQTPPRVGLTLVRPDPDDKNVLMSVAGTYTSPEGAVEGVVLVDGGIENHRAKPWEGVLLVVGGAPELVRRTDDTLSDAGVAALQKRRASMIQGHLLVWDSAVLPIKPSPPLLRRAIITGKDPSFAIVESQQKLELAQFTADLVALGAVAAMNLDMGRWSEGFYRDPKTGQRRRLGDDFRRTDKQTNWMVFLRDRPPRGG